MSKALKLELRRLVVNRQGYSNGGRTYYGVGLPLYEAHNPATGEFLVFRAEDRAEAKDILRKVVANPEDPALRHRISSYDARKFVG